MNKSRIQRITTLVAALVLTHMPNVHSSRPRVISQDELAEIKLRTEERLLLVQEKRLLRAEEHKQLK